MTCGFTLRNYRITKLRNRSRGYVLISLMLFLALLAMAALAVLPNMAFQVKRDREEEMLHRGVAYSRGIRRFYKKFGRYPARIEELENTNNLRFIRKRYTDPTNIVQGKEEDFRILHMSDVNISMGPGLGVGGATGLRGAPGVPVSPGQGQPVSTPTNPQSTTPALGGATVSLNPQTDSGAPDSSTSSSSEGSSSGFGGQVFGGGPILGVVSRSKNKTVREFCNKSHYKDWLFIYDPSTDRGGTLNAPWCPLAVGQGVGTNITQPVAGQPNTGQPAGTPLPGQPNTGPQGGTPVQPNPGGDMPPEQ